ncbi:SRPBCC family protein [Sedimentitalea arenosa]|jgi:uncharacterized protein YndB with AHSA1/START domain|uniref:SRPBCC family protein n=1 Tax=Sedimentitalea arenosa TaxID=2798803 RepID=A0A8J7LS20_9RHOB|nr:SRPBCC family protein [Arenibacterium arenosum]MBJ6372373.1 SRPBCC family protein [Arenibacterium arenosum]
MQFSTREDIDAPIDAVFAMVSDARRFERSAIRRGADVARTRGEGAPTIGSTWRVRFPMRGKHRNLEVVVIDCEPPNAMTFSGVSQGIDGRLTLDLIALSPHRTRMALVVNMAPKSIAARLFLQSLKLAKTTLTKRYKLRIAEFARTLERRYRDSA